MSIDNNSTKKPICQEHTSAVEQELQEKFAPRRLQSEMLAGSYERLHFDNRAHRVNECGTYLGFGLPTDPAAGLHRGVPAAGLELTKPKLVTANFCRDRLCPMCNWRRSHKIFGQVSKIMSHISSDYAFIFVTLTVPNVQGCDLSKKIDEMQAAWDRLLHYKTIKQAVKGYFKAFEVTRNKKRSSPSYGTYHPHYHTVFAVAKDYFSGSDYIERDDLLKLWQKATRDPTITQVDMRRAGTKKKREGMSDADALAASVAEIAKYAVKSSDFLGKVDKAGRVYAPLPDIEQDEIVLTLANALAGRRLCSFGGCFDEARKLLNLEDPEDGDLIHDDDDILNPDLLGMIAYYGWSCGAYKLIKLVPKSSMNKNNVIVECEDE